MNNQEFLQLLEKRFLEHPERHLGLKWQAVRDALSKNDKINILIRMEDSGGEVDVVQETDKAFWFFDCAKESPQERRSVCYDEAALAARKEHKPQTSAEQMAREIGAEILDEEDYLYLQSLGDFDVKSQSWIQTELAFRQTGDALFGNKRHGRTFVYYNGAGSYYRTRGFRCKLEIEK